MTFAFTTMLGLNASTAAIGEPSLLRGISSGVTQPVHEPTIGVVSKLYAGSADATMTVVVGGIFLTTMSAFIGPRLTFFESVTDGKRTFELTKALCVLDEVVDGIWTRSNEELAIFAAGESPEQMESAFFTHFAAAWDHLANEPDVLLTRDAIVLRDKLRTLVATVRSPRVVLRQATGRVRSGESAHAE
jgi:hypothetical protein